MEKLIIDGLMAASTLESGMVASPMGVASLFSPQVGILPSQRFVASHLAEMKDVWVSEHLSVRVTGMRLRCCHYVSTKP